MLEVAGRFAKILSRLPFGLDPRTSAECESAKRNTTTIEGQLNEWSGTDGNGNGGGQRRKGRQRQDEDASERGGSNLGTPSLGGFKRTNETLL